ncbi:hypothetical protein V6N12_067940 [Hibiscus sabdariffa]|uniref:Uncharacterized protein n=1 Tax=Hibiscus sabdariffa TaxID=183260 RepID=A0ABR2FNR4_9ROSI
MVLNVETASRLRVSVHEVGSTPFFHANMYLHLQVQQEMQKIQRNPSTRQVKIEARKCRVEQSSFCSMDLIKATSMADALAVRSSNVCFLHLMKFNTSLVILGRNCVKIASFQFMTLEQHHFSMQTCITIFKFSKQYNIEENESM